MIPNGWTKNKWLTFKAIYPKTYMFRLHHPKKISTNKVTSWAIIATITRPNGTWFDRTITNVDNETATAVDTFLTKELDNE